MTAGLELGVGVGGGAGRGAGLGVRTNGPLWYFLAISPILRQPDIQRCAGAGRAEGVAAPVSAQAGRDRRGGAARPSRVIIVHCHSVHED